MKYKKFTAEEIVKARTNKWLQDEIIENYHDAIYQVASQIVKKTRLYDMDDLINLGRFGVYNAIMKFDETKGVEFNTYCFYHLRHRVVNALRNTGNGSSKNSNREFKKRIDATMGSTNIRMSPDTDDTFEDLIESVLANGLETMLKEELYFEFWKDVKERVNEDQYEALYLHYFHGYKQREIADMKNISLRAASGRIYTGIKKLRDTLDLNKFIG